MSTPEAVFFEAFDGLVRLAPGSDSSTVRALERVKQLLQPKRILDIGCGAGAQTLVLATNCAADIVAVDSHGPFLDVLNSKAAELGVAGRVRTIEASMADLPVKLHGEIFDVLWAEGSIYVIGFDHGLEAWRGLLRNGGVLACTEVSWITDSPSDATRAFWSKEYPAIRGIAENVAAAESQGYACIDRFTLPADDWLKSYYEPLEARIMILREKYSDDAVANGVLDMLQAEIDIYRNAGHEYGYVFFLLQRQDSL